ncbi:MAG: FAD-dependent oxidoreductase [Chloroflexaceae bacterium]|nr:FAD-dependent oxidoreductase [Chloroflexaceae bacterium]
MNVESILVGAGIAGLTCARLLHEAGRQVILFEASDAVGGRVRSDSVDGYTLDRGFQVLFDAYPAVQRQLNMAALHPRFFEPGAIVCIEGQRAILTDPLRERPGSNLIATLLTPVLNPLDKIRTLLLARELSHTTIEAIISGPDQSTWDYLRERGLSEKAIKTFFQAFLGGIFLDRSLHTSAKNAMFTLKMLADGHTLVPALGMAAISQQLAMPLQAAGKIQLHTRVERLLYQDKRVIGVGLEDGREVLANSVVLATTAPEAARLSNLNLSRDYVQTTTVYFGGHIRLYHQKKLLLHAAPDAFVNNAMLLSNVAPEYAPSNRHLLSATLLGIPTLDDDEIYARTLADLRLMWCGNERAQLALETYQPLAIYRIEQAQFMQPPGVHPTLPNNATEQPGLFLAAEFTEASSINAAMISGEKCAQMLLSQSHGAAGSRFHTA